STAVNQLYSLDTNGQNVTLATALVSSGGSLTKLGSGAPTLTAANTYTAGTNLVGGTLNINNASALGTGTFTIAGGTTIDNTSGGALSLTNAQTRNGDFTFTGSHNLTFSGNVALGAATRQVTVSGGTLTESGAFSG